MTRQYLIPKTGTGGPTDMWRPKYLDGQRYSCWDHGAEPVFIVEVALSDDQHRALQAYPDVIPLAVITPHTVARIRAWKFPLTSEDPTQVRAELDRYARISRRLHGRGIVLAPADFLQRLQQGEA